MGTSRPARGEPTGSWHTINCRFDAAHTSPNIYLMMWLITRRASSPSSSSFTESMNILQGLWVDGGGVGSVTDGGGGWFMHTHLLYVQLVGDGFGAVFCMLLEGDWLCMAGGGLCVAGGIWFRTVMHAAGGRWLTRGWRLFMPIW